MVSFDIFDTLILRPYACPADLFVHLEKINCCDGFAKNRISAERLAHKNTDAEEVTLNEIYKYLPAKFKKFKATEIKLEYEASRANPEIQKLYNYAQKKGKTVIIVSDMYLPRWAIEEMLRKCGYVGYYKLYLSSERRKTKNSSNLYREILNELKVAPKEIVHIGDNYFSDCEQAKKVGINALYYPKLTDRFLKNRNNEKFKKFYAQNRELFRSIVIAQLAYKQSQDESKVMSQSKYWYNVGYQICGPFVFAFCNFVSKQPFLKNCRDVAFIGRGAYVPFKIFKILNPQILSHYIYVPRILGKMCNGKFAQNPLDDNNDTYKLYFAPVWGEHVFLSKEEWLHFCIDHLKEMKKISMQRNNEYYAYLSSKFNANSESLIMVDSITTAWTAQTLLERILKKVKIWGTYVWADSKNSANHLYTSFIDSNLQVKKFSNFDFIEFIMTAPEPPIIDIKNKTAIYKTLTKYEAINNEISRHIAEGAMDFARDSLEILKNSDMNSKAALDLVNSYLNYPNSDDIKYRCHVVDYADVSHSQYYPIFYDKVKITILSLFSFESIYGEYITRFLNRFPFIKVVTTSKERVIYLFKILPILKMQNYRSSGN